MPTLAEHIQAVIDVAGHSDIPDRLDLYDEFEAEFKPLLGRSARWGAFCYIMRNQLAREECCVIETGTLREPGNWKGDGQSTRLWQWLAERKKTLVMSLDMDLRACQLASRECPGVHVTCMDSVTFLRGFMPFSVTLLYLDSMVWEPGQEEACWMHQDAELSAIWGRLPSGCLIASDDQQTKERGKPVLTRKLLSAMGIEPVFDEYICVWQK